MERDAKQSRQTDAQAEHQPLADAHRQQPGDNQQRLPNFGIDTQHIVKTNRHLDKQDQHNQKDRSCIVPNIAEANDNESRDCQRENVGVSQTNQRPRIM